MNINQAFLINSNNFYNELNEGITLEQANEQHNALSLNSKEISDIEHKIFFENTKNYAEQEICIDSNLQLTSIEAKHLENEGAFLAFIKGDEFKAILDDVIKDINKLTELSLPYVIDKNKFKDEMYTLVTRLANIHRYGENGIRSLLEFFRFSREQIKTSIQIFNLIKESNTNETQKLASENQLKIILSSSIEDGMNLCIAGVISRVLLLYSGLKNFLGKGKLIKEIITNIVSALAQDTIKNEITAGNKLSNKMMNVHEINSLKKIMEKPFGITCPYDPSAKDITDYFTRKQFENKAEIVACPYNILLTLIDEMSARLENIIPKECEKIFTTGVKVNDIPEGLMSNIDNFFINPLNSMLLSDDSAPINITDILEVNDYVYTISNLQAKLSFLIPQKLLGKKAKWIVGEISTQYCSADSEQLIVAIGNSYFRVIDKQNLYTHNKEVNFTFENTIPVQLQHITPELITNNNLQKASYRPLIINALQNTNAEEILNLLNNSETKNILQQDSEFLEYLSEIISIKIAKNPELKKNLTKIICNEIILASEKNTNILIGYFNYILFMKSTLLEPILHKLLEEKIDITDILVELEIPQIINLSSLKQLCDQALNITFNTEYSKQKLIDKFTKIHEKLMQYGHSHVIPLIISSNFINPILGNITTKDNEHELLICARYRNAESIKIILQENARRSEQDKLKINQQNNYGDTALMISARNGDVATLTEILKETNVSINMQKHNGFTALMMATQGGHFECIKILLKHEANVDAKQKDGFTALMIATKGGHSECIKILLEHEANVNAKHNNDSTALIIAAEEGHSECIKILLEHEANVDAKHNDGFTALMIAAERGHFECIKILLEHEANVDAKQNDGFTALMVATNGGHSECIKILLKYKANVNFENKYGYTALMMAVVVGNSECIKILLEHKIDIDRPNKYGDRALMVATLKGHFECVKILLEHKVSVDPSDEYGNTSLILAAEGGYSECIKILLEHKANVNRFNKYGDTALIRAAEGGYSECIKILLEHKANVDLSNNDGDTALIRAAEGGYSECIKILLEHEAEIDQTNKYGKTALMYAVEKGDNATEEDRAEFIELLLEHKAKFDSKLENDNYTSLMIAAYYGYYSCMEILLKHKTYIDYNTALKIAIEKGHYECIKILLEHETNTNKDGSIALITAAQKGDSECIKILLEQKANVNLSSNYGFTALIFAAKNGHAECIKILLEHEANVNLSSNYGSTALIFATKNGHAECIKILLEHKVNVDAKQIDDGYTALMIATKKGHDECVKILLEHEASVDLSNEYGNTSLILAAEGGYSECIKILLKHKANVDRSNDDGDTALIRAAEKGHDECVKILLEHKANVDAKQIDDGAAIPD